MADTFGNISGGIIAAMIGIPFLFFVLLPALLIVTLPLWVPFMPAVMTTGRKINKRARLNVLILDDDLISIAPLLVALEESLAKYTTVENAEDAMVELAKDRFDLVICDLMMPGLSGEEALKEAERRLTLARVLPVVFYTGSGRKLVDLSCQNLTSFDVKEVWEKKMPYLSLKGRLLARLENVDETIGKAS